jgi:hypothetical protein
MTERETETETASLEGERRTFCSILLSCRIKGQVSNFTGVEGTVF